MAGVDFVGPRPKKLWKTTVALACLKRTLERLVRLSDQSPGQSHEGEACGVAVDTYHSALGLDEEPAAVAASLAQCALIIMDEVSTCSCHTSSTSASSGHSASNSPWQGTRCRWAASATNVRGTAPCGNAWSSGPSCTSLPLQGPGNQQGPGGAAHRGQDAQVVAEAKAWAPPQPSVEGVRKLLKAHPDTVVLTSTRQGADGMNELALQALFPSRRPLLS